MAIRSSARIKIPWVVTGLLIAIFLTFSSEIMGDGEALCANWGFTSSHPTLVGALASLFLHDPNNLWHVGGNVLMLAVLGTVVEVEVGSLAFLGLFFLAGLGGISLHYLVDPNSTTTLVGASGAIFGVMAVAAVIRPALLGFVTIYAGINIWHVLTDAQSTVSAACHIGGFAIGALIVVGARMRIAVKEETS